MTYILDGAMMNTKEKAHDHLQEQLALPPYYGRNLDALYDCLSVMSGRIKMYHTAEMRRSLAAYGEKILRVLKDAQSEFLSIEFVD